MSTRIALKSLDKGWYDLGDPAMDLIIDPNELEVRSDEPISAGVVDLLWRSDARIYADSPAQLKRFVCWLALYDDIFPPTEFYVGFKIPWNGEDWEIGHHSTIDVILGQIRNLPKEAKHDQG